MQSAAMKQRVTESQQVLEWMAQSALQTRRADLRTLLEDKFGPLPSTVVQQIEAVNDLDRLKAAIRQVSRIQNLTDLQL
jgi:hypothetical protein